MPSSAQLEIRPLTLWRALAELPEKGLGGGLARDREFRELVLKRAPVQPEHTRCLADLAVALAQHAFDVLVLEPRERRDQAARARPA